MNGASLAVALIGQALAVARDLVVKHAVKQVDRLMSNAGIDVWDSFARWVPQQVAARADILVAMDWTDFVHGGQSTLVLSLVTGHGAAARADRLAGGDRQPPQRLRGCLPAPPGRKRSIKLRRRLAGWSPDYLYSLLGPVP